MSKNIHIIEPRPYAKIGATFKVRGIVPLSWLKTEWGWYRGDLSIEFIDSDGQTFIGTGIPLPEIGWLSRLMGSVFFEKTFQFDWINVGFLERSQGRINIKITGENREDHCIFIPLIVDEFEPEEGVNPEIVFRHSRMEEIITQYEEDLRNYNAASQEIEKRRNVKDGLSKEGPWDSYLFGPAASTAHGIWQILEESNDEFSEYLYSEEDTMERELEERYKDALRWRGPLLRGIVSKIGPFELRVFSDDHGRHFHVIHRDKRINARFSFPEIRLMNYKGSQNTISSKQEKRIREYCLTPEIFRKFEEEFAKRPQK